MIFNAGQLDCLLLRGKRRKLPPEITLYAQEITYLRKRLGKSHGRGIVMTEHATGKARGENRSPKGKPAGFDSGETVRN